MEEELGPIGPASAGVVWPARPVAAAMPPMMPNRNVRLSIAQYSLARSPPRSLRRGPLEINDFLQLAADVAVLHE